MEIELPGVECDDSDVQINERELAVTGEIRERGREGVLRSSSRGVPTVTIPKA
ncbi:Hsp20/alpha crystallin family protein [Streptomyces sp. NPDC005727]|uniref:Hsp20/alpha crystallin family protein n=1 Tax=Streptomyces sp. NPDC005727 TaxID=3157053 RepID=UPI0033EBBB7F